MSEVTGRRVEVGVAGLLVVAIESDYFTFVAILL